MKTSSLRNVVKAVVLMLLISFTGCGDSNVAGIHDSQSTLSASGDRLGGKADSTSITLDLNLRFKSGSISDSKVLESNLGYKFYSIATLDRDLKPHEQLDLQQIQPKGIFALYLSATGTFDLSNSDGMKFSSKSLLMEKCAFIDLKLKNNESVSIHVKGILAGE